MEGCQGKSKLRQHGCRHCFESHGLTSPTSLNTLSREATIDSPASLTDADRLRYLKDLREIALRERCNVHAYVLMTKSRVSADHARSQRPGFMLDVHTGAALGE